MVDFNPDEFLAQASAPAPQTAPPTAGVAGGEAAGHSFDPDAFLNAAPSIDNLTGEEMPDKYSGRTPETAMNKSPLTPLDRYKLSLGNEAGNIQFLQKRFEAVKPIVGEDGKPTKELAVLEHGKWARVDPINGDIADPWEKAKEYAKDAAGLGPIGIGIGATAAIGAVIAAPLAAGAALAGGALTAGTTSAIAVGSAAAGGALAAGVRTSLGRIAGTYDATPAEQAWDIGFETLLNAGGEKILMGVKPTAGWVANRLGPIAEKFKDVVDDVMPDAVRSAGTALVNSPRAIFKKIFASYSVGEDNFDTMVKYTEAVKSMMKSVYQAAGGKTAIYHDEVTRIQTEEAKSIAMNSRNVLSQIYGSMRNKIVEQVPENFSANYDDVLKGSYSDAITKNIGKLVVGDKNLMGAEAAEYIAKNGMKNARFQMLTQAEMGSMVRAGAELGDDLGVLAADKEAYGMVRSYYKSLETFGGGVDRTGKAGAKALLDFKKTAGEISWSFANKEKAQGLPGVKRIIDNSRASMDTSVRGALEKYGMGKHFDELNSTYSELNKQFSPLLTASERYAKSGDTKVFEGLLSSFLARPGKQGSKRLAVDYAIDAAEANGLKALSNNLSNSKLQIQIGEAAKAFNPITSGMIKADKLAAGQVGLAALASTHPLFLGAIVAAQTLRSPTTAMAAIGVTQSLFKGQQFLAQQTPKALDAFLSNPKAIEMFTNSVVQAPFVRQQTEQALMQKIQGQ